MSEANQPRGILRNAPDRPTYKSPEGKTEVSDIDRKKVIENTMLNAKLTADSKEAKAILAEIADRKKNPSNSLNADHLQWDEKNLYQTEQEKNATMKIDEPKTPYQGGFDPNNDYYRTDNEDDLDDPGFTLGEPEVQLSEAPKMESLNGGTIIRDETQPEEEEEEGEEQEEEHEEPANLSAEEKHKRFEMMRKQHYHSKGNVLHQPLPAEDEEE
ncbi:unnamed protein product [Kuraishia capsulata CBS 1993]|uniref:Protein GLC8 n=1 Tax=Kuraishia capsulata CBS 1993 TaxID=1382522 RepID=W6MY19_9ASCO|nr:uncharacterized protein KUCA_T00005859001 [Kuraishia capsulata CBS 1993]CDK29865.1 unnamed protein product [Kuraishia capsulata CBS 1993]